MRKGLIASVTAAGILVTSLLLTPAWAVPNYPSAAEVAAAKRSVTEKRKMITRIEGILNTLESEARELEAVALEKSEQYIRALKRADDMREKVKSLQDQAKASANKAETARVQLGQLVAQMFRDRSANDITLELFFNPESAEDLLFEMSMQEIVAQRTESIYQSALDQQAQAQALELELEEAKKQLEAVEAEAKKLFDEAQAAADAVIAKVRSTERERATMMSQLASLQDNAEDLERQRREGLEAERRQNAVKTAPTAPELYTVGPPNTDLVERAIDFAKEQLGERYVLGGAGPNVWDCSGITMKSYASVGVYIGWHSATAQYNVLAAQRKLVPFQDAQRGDLIWWSEEEAFSGDKYHVAIYLGDGMMLEAPNPARTVRIGPTMVVQPLLAKPGGF